MSSPKKLQISSFCIAMYDAKDVEKLRTDERVKYMVQGTEICPTTGRTHYQTYCEIKKTRVSVLFKEYPNTSFRDSKGKFLTRRGKPSQARDYCKKGDQSHEEWKSQGVAGPNYGKNSTNINKSKRGI